MPAARAEPVSSAVLKAVRSLHDASGTGRLVGRALGVYEVKTLIAVGGMGEVYRAVDSRLNRTVAIKTLPTELANDWERRERFKREANVISNGWQARLGICREFCGLRCR